MDFNNKPYIPTFWYSSNNFGDAITHYLVQKISGKMPVFLEPHEQETKIMVTGSILNNDVKNAIAWGCGIANAEDCIPNHDIRAVRGKLLWQKLKNLKENPPKDDDGKPVINYTYDTEKIAIGDPCLLLPKYYNPKISKKYSVGIIPHYIDAKDFWNKIDKTQSELDDWGILVIDVNSQIENFINQVLSCEIILSSSLHGIICADAYGVPSTYIQITNRILGDGFKYRDWFANFSNRDFRYYDWRESEKIAVEDIIEIFKNENNKIVWNKQLSISLQNLIETCPFK